jgi:hypothetical protein
LIALGPYAKALPEPYVVTTRANAHFTNGDVHIVVSDDYDATWYKKFLHDSEQVNIENINVTSVKDFFSMLLAHAFASNDRWAIKELPEFKKRYESFVDEKKNEPCDKPLLKWAHAADVLRVALACCAPGQSAILDLDTLPVKSFTDQEIDGYGMAYKPNAGNAIVIFKPGTQYQQDLREAFGPWLGDDFGSFLRSYADPIFAEVDNILGEEDPNDINEAIGVITRRIETLEASPKSENSDLLDKWHDIRDMLENARDEGKLLLIGNSLVASAHEMRSI